MYLTIRIPTLKVSQELLYKESQELQKNSIPEKTKKIRLIHFPN
jgi:hypothetical protein